MANKSNVNLTFVHYGFGCYAYSLHVSQSAMKGLKATRMCMAGYCKATGNGFTNTCQKQISLTYINFTTS